MEHLPERCEEMIKVANIKWKYAKFKYMNELIQLIKNGLAKHNIRVNMVPLAEGFEFRPITGENNKLFMSTVENKVVLAEGNPRIKEIGRNYLITKRVTKEQFDGFFNEIQSGLDSLGLLADIEMVIPKTRDVVVLRKGMEKFNNYPEIKSFPVKK